MSGGHFDYTQYKIETCAESLREIIATHKDKDQFGDCYDFSPATIIKLRLTADMLEKTAKMLQRVDWLVCGDDSEDTFHERWKEDGL